MGNEGHKALDELVTAFRQDGFYSPEAPKVVGNQFTLTVKVERRAPEEYGKHKLKSVEKAPLDNGDDMGDLP